MCAGASYWSGIARVVYALSEHGLAAIVAEQEGVPTMHLPCRNVFARGGRPVVVAGPADLPEATAVHDGIWGLTHRTRFRHSARDLREHRVDLGDPVRLLGIRRERRLERVPRERRELGRAE